MTRTTKFLYVCQTAKWHSVPRTWATEFRDALSGGLVRVGFGGIIELTSAGHRALEADRKE